MAKHYSSSFLLPSLLLLLNFTYITTVPNAAPTTAPTPSTTPNTTFSFVPQPSITPSTALPLLPQPSPNPTPRPPHHQQQLNNIIGALVGTGDFTGWASILSSSNLTALIPLSATLFIPADDSLPPTDAFPVTMDPFLFPYHIVPQRLTFADLILFKPLSRLPTLLPSRSILITNTSLSNFTLDDARITHPDLFATVAFTVHGVANLLDYSVYGLPSTITADAPPRKPNMQPQPGEEFTGEHGDGSGDYQPPDLRYDHSNAACVRSDAWVTFILAFAAVSVSVLKIYTFANLGRCLMFSADDAIESPSIEARVMAGCFCSQVAGCSVVAAVN